MSKKIIHTQGAPAPIGPYSQAVQVGDLIFLSGQIAIDPESGTLKIDNLEEEVTLVMKNISAILTEAGTGLNNIIKTSIFLKNMDDFSEVNRLYGAYFESNFPARETVEVARLPKDVNVEISVIAKV